ncbi:hypothetical protein J6590_015760 [Homalodisca vitripennis]|nr:hypothetical protein J6590_015760 [Homalodisca vitripennis]
MEEPDEVTKKRAEWNEEQMQEALNAVGNGMSVNQKNEQPEPLQKKIKKKTIFKQSDGKVCNPPIPFTSGINIKPSTKSSQKGVSQKKCWYCFIRKEVVICDQRYKDVLRLDMGRKSLVTVVQRERAAFMGARCRPNKNTN